MEFIRPLRVDEFFDKQLGSLSLPRCEAPIPEDPSLEEQVSSAVELEKIVEQIRPQRNNLYAVISIGSANEYREQDADFVAITPEYDSSRQVNGSSRGLTRTPEGEVHLHYMTLNYLLKLEENKLAKQTPPNMHDRDSNIDSQLYSTILQGVPIVTSEMYDEFSRKYPNPEHKIHWHQEGDKLHGEIQTHTVKT